MTQALGTGIYVIDDTRTGRIRVRSVDHTVVAERALAGAKELRKPRVVCRHGGAVANSYGYPASTEAVLAVAIDDQRVAVWATQLPANKVTVGGAAAACLAEARPVFDHRHNAQSRKRACREVVQIARAEICFLEAGEIARQKRELRRARRAAAPQPTLDERLRAHKMAYLRSLGMRLPYRAVVKYGPPEVEWAGGKPTISWDASSRPRRVAPDRVQIGQWIYDPGLVAVAYAPHGDGRDVAAFRAETNQERRRMMYAACGERLVEALDLRPVHEDEYGQLLRSPYGLLVRVTCPSTGSVYYLPVPESVPDPTPERPWQTRRITTAHAAVASTFGLRAEEYQPVAQA